MTQPDLTKYGFSDEQQQVYDMVYRFSRDELHPLCERMDREDWFPEERFRSLHEVGLLGTSIPAEWSLDMAMPLTFLALVGPMLRTFAHMAAAMTSCVLALALAFVPYNLGLLVAAIAALAVGAEIERRKDAR